MGNKENSNIDDNINNNLNDIKNNNTNSSTNNNINYISSNRKAYFHLPGLFEFYEFYKVFLSLFYEHTTRHSLFASATFLPQRSALAVGNSPL